MELSQIIIQKIGNNGAISFRDFMDMCLYYPELGYYTSPKEKIGKSGDYYTSTTLTPVYGAMIAKQLEEMWYILGEGAFTIVEYGAGTGALCHDILDHIKKNKAFYNKVSYCIIEKSPSMRKKEQQHLHEKVSWHNSIGEIAGFTGCIISNELLDNFPVHQVVMEDELMEVFVDYNNGFIERLRPACSAIKDYVNELDIVLPGGFRTEINLDATKWIEEVAVSLKKGYVLTIDYGYHSSELYKSHRSQGTLICYNKHRVNDHPYDAIGEQDITAHVNFSALHHWGLKTGLDLSGYTNQAHFLLGLGLTEHLKKITEHEPVNFNNYKKEAYLKRILLIEMGDKFKVMIQQKNVPVQELLGLKLSNTIARPAATTGILYAA